MHTAPGGSQTRWALVVAAGGPHQKEVRSALVSLFVRTTGIRCIPICAGADNAALIDVYMCKRMRKKPRQNLTVCIGGAGFLARNPLRTKFLEVGYRIHRIGTRNAALTFRFAIVPCYAACLTHPRSSLSINIGFA